MEKHQAFYFYVLNNTNRTANTFSYTYDSLNRLTNAAAGNNLSEAINYDVMGNITSNC